VTAIKMKSYLFLFFLLIPSIYAMYGGDMVNLKTIENCDELSIIVNGNQIIDDGEYSFLGCNFSNDIWVCNCDGNDFNLIIETTPQTINEYILTINYSYHVETGSGGGSHRKTETIIVEPSIEINDSVSNQTGFVDWLQDDFIKKYIKEKNRQIKKPEQEEEKVENKTIIKQNETYIEEPPVEQKGFFAKVFDKIKAFFRWLF